MTAASPGPGRPGAAPYVLLSVATSLDGAIDSATPPRLLLSNPADFDRVDQLRAAADAILVGAATIRADDPRLLVVDPRRRAERCARGVAEQPLRVTLTASGELDAAARWLHCDGPRLVYTTDEVLPRLRDRLAGLAEVVTLGAGIDLRALLGDLAGRGVRRLMVEGGGRIHTSFLAEGLADELRLAIAPLLVGQAQAPRFAYPARYPGAPGRRMRLVGVEMVGDVAVLRYHPKEESAPPEPAGRSPEPAG